MRSTTSLPAPIFRKTFACGIRFRERRALSCTTSLRVSIRDRIRSSSGFFASPDMSASEVQSQLYLALDRGYITRENLERVYGLADDTKRCINGLIRYLTKHTR